MTLEGAAGDTAEQMKTTLHLTQDAETRHSGFAQLSFNGEHKGYVLSTANALWVQQDFFILPNFSDTIKNYYAGEAKNVDFVKETEKSRLEINQWVEDKTNNKITNLIPQEF